MLKKLFVLCLCVAVVFMMSSSAFAADKAAPKDDKAKVCEHGKDCKDCKDKGKDKCAKHKDCCAKKDGAKKDEKKEEKK
jgi:hypothetical protein